CPRFSTSQPSTSFCTLSLHDALPISSPVTRGSVIGDETRLSRCVGFASRPAGSRKRAIFCYNGQTLSPKACCRIGFQITASNQRDRKSTRLNSSHVSISYAVFCLKKK